MSDLKGSDLENTTYDAQQLVQEITTGEEKAPKVNVEADYERSKQFDVAEIDRTEAGAQAAADATAMSGAASSSTATPSETGDPADFLQMAKEVTPKEEK
ncbi:MAG: hypothetical protein HC827_15510 [Cyanobacteria bacterium RM1_2_2]|nr:hypothetical protein [Cyanobacteria bacterium RM1_2_2]